MKKIIVPVDFSQCSVAALDYAVSLAEISSTKIFVIHAVHNPLHYYATTEVINPSVVVDNMYPVLLNNLEKASKSNLRNLINSKSKYKILNIETKVLVGSSVYKEILNFADKIKPDLIVMGTNGTNNLIKILIGTNAERIIRFTEFPVMVVSTKFRKVKINKVVFATDFSSNMFRSFKLINNIIKASSPEIHILRINTHDDFMSLSHVEKNFKQLIKQYKGNFIQNIRPSTYIDEGIVKYANRIKADLIALGVRRKKGPSRYLGNRILEGVLRATKIPLLAVDVQ